MEEYGGEFDEAEWRHAQQELERDLAPKKPLLPGIETVLGVLLGLAVLIYFLFFNHPLPR